MNNFPKKTLASSTLHNPMPSFTYKLLYPITWIIVAFAFLTGAFLLISDVFAVHLPHMPLSAAPLLLIGAAYLAFQVLIRAQLLDFFKALIVSSAFILWGVDQLLPSGWFATTLGDIVIVLYVLDLGWMMMDRLKQQRQNSHAQSAKSAYESSILSPPLDKSTPHLLNSTSSEDQHHLSEHFVAFSTGTTPLLKRNRLTSLPCTCASPLAPLHSSTCCCAMKEASGR